MKLSIIRILMKIIINDQDKHMINKQNKKYSKRFDVNQYLKACSECKKPLKTSVFQSIKVLNRIF